MDIIWEGIWQTETPSKGEAKIPYALTEIVDLI